MHLPEKHGLPLFLHFRRSNARAPVASSCVVSKEITQSATVLTTAGAEIKKKTKSGQRKRTRLARKRRSYKKSSKTEKCMVSVNLRKSIQKSVFLNMQLQVSHVRTVKVRSLRILKNEKRGPRILNAFRMTPISFAASTEVQLVPKTN